MLSKFGLKIKVKSRRDCCSPAWRGALSFFYGSQAILYVRVYIHNKGMSWQIKRAKYISIKNEGRRQAHPASTEIGSFCTRALRGD